MAEGPERPDFDHLPGLPTDGQVAFSYERDPAVLGCSQENEREMRSLLEHVIHARPLFVPAGEAAPFALRVVVKKAGAGLIRATFELLDGAGISIGVSQLHNRSCDGLHLELAASIGLLLQPRAPEPPPACPTCPVPCDAACREAIKEELRGEVWQELRDEVEDGIRQEIRRECKERYCPRVDLHAVISAGALVGFNYAADPAPGFWLAGEARGPWWSVMIEARGVLPTREYTLLNGLGTADLSTFSGLLSPCLRWKWLSGCALVEVGAAIHSIPGSFDDGASDPFMGLGLRARLDIPITAGFEARLFGDAMGHPMGVVLTLRDPTGPGGTENPAIVEYEVPRIFSAFVGVGIARAFE